MPRILLRNCRLVGEFQGVENSLKQGSVDIFIGADGNIESVVKGGASLEHTAQPVRSGEEEAQVVEVKGAYVSPGWVDLHTHVYAGICAVDSEPNALGPETGVAAVVDAGSAGEASFSGFRAAAESHSGFFIKEFLNISSIGLVAANKVMEFTGLEAVALDRIHDVASANSDIIRGIKVRASRDVVRHWELIPVKLGVCIGDILGLPVMVHVGEPPVFIADLVHVLGEGDIVTHCFNGKIGGDLATTPGLVDVYKEACAKGIRFDVGHGSASFSFAAARKGIENGIIPFSISTDGYSLNLNGPVYDLATTMSKLLAVGMSLEQVIVCSSTNPASALGLSDWGSLRPGSQASLTVFSLRSGDFDLTDSNNRTDLPVIPEARKTMRLSTFIEPLYTVVRGQVWKAGSRFLKSQR